MGTQTSESEIGAEPLAAEMSASRPRGHWLAAICRFTLLALVSAGALAAAAGIGSWCLYGSVRGGIARLEGYALAVDSFTKSAGRVPPGGTGHASFTLTNLEPTPVTILGAETSCRCTTVSDLPVTLAPGEQRSLNIAVTPSPNEKRSHVENTALLFLDVASRRILLSIETEVVPSEGPSAAPLPKRGS